MISRIDAIIRSLRQFTRRRTGNITPCRDLAQMFSAARELLAMRHRSLQATLVLPQGTAATVSGDEVRTQQVLVNVPNALDVCGASSAVITVNWQMQGKTLNVFIGDNGLAGLRHCCLRY